MQSPVPLPPSIKNPVRPLSKLAIPPNGGPFLGSAQAYSSNLTFFFLPLLSALSATRYDALIEIRVAPVPIRPVHSKDLDKVVGAGFPRL